MKTEYHVRPVTRYVVTRYESIAGEDGLYYGGSSRVIGEFPNGQQADDIADGMVAKDMSAGIESGRARHGLSLGEVISGKRNLTESEGLGSIADQGESGAMIGITTGYLLDPLEQAIDQSARIVVESTGELARRFSLHLDSLLDIQLKRASRQQ